MVGTVIGALKGQTTETGFVRGAGIGAVTGAVTAVQLLEPKLDGESLSKVNDGSVHSLNSILQNPTFRKRHISIYKCTCALHCIVLIETWK